MSRTRAVAKQADVVRAIKAAKLAGLTVSGVEVISDGYRIVTRESGHKREHTTAAQEQATIAERLRKAREEWRN